MPSALPPPLMTSEPGSFARETIEKRKPRIIADVLSDAAYPANVRRQLEAFAHEIASGPLEGPLVGIPLYEEWLSEFQEWQGRTWLQIPWYFAESYFYVRLLAIIGYFEGRAGDPFQQRKDAHLQQSQSIMPSLAQAERLSATAEPLAAFTLLLRRSLWGNRLDLSNEAITERHRGDPSHLEDTALAVDDGAVAYQAIISAPTRPVTFICDNCGPELIADLHLADWLLRGSPRQVIFELKAQPFFVSDAMIKDVQATVEYLCACGEAEVERLGERLRESITAGRLVLRDHPFWTGPRHYTRLPPDLAERLRESALVIAKGDVNYRRFLEDRHWPFQTPISHIVDYFPANLLLLRTFKGELAAGLDKVTIERLAATGDDWLINGRHGVVQYIAKAQALATM
ncbi:MAG: damage-control phosphatase ARMT1 family protein [Anaerolineae bacterium]